jgi:hypothetical protein
MVDQGLALSAQVLRQVANLVEGLDAGQRAQFAAGRLRVALVTVAAPCEPVETSTSVGVPSDVVAAGSTTNDADSATRTGVLRRPREDQARDGRDPVAVREALLAMTSRDAARDHLVGLRLTAAALQKLAAAFDVPTGSKDKKDVVIRKIVDGVVGNRLSSRAMLDGVRAV